MERMKTFLTYALMIIGFIVISMVLENGLLMAMYSEIPGEFYGYYAPTNSRFRIDHSSAKACNVNGYLKFDLINSTGSFVDQCYLKIDLYNGRDLLAHTEYIEVRGMQDNAVKPFNIKFKAT